jgi:very-short-patch-repair endonuclease
MDDAFPISLDDIALRRDLVAEGWTDRDIIRAVRSGVLTKVRYGAYVPTELVRGMDDVDLFRVRSRAVIRTAHAASVLSHHASLAEWQVPLWGVDLRQTDLTRTDLKAGRSEAGIVHHCGLVQSDEWTHRNGVPVMEVARAVSEVVVSHPPEVGLVAASGALHNKRVTPEELRQAADRAERWPNSLNLRLVLARADARLSSVAEARTWHLFHEHRIERPEMQIEVYDEHGVLVGIVDFVWRHRRAFLEVDGRIKYERYRRPGETLEQYLMREKRRQEIICQLTGWTCLRITWADLANPLRTANRIRAVLGSRTTPAAS